MTGRLTMSNYNTYMPSSPFSLSSEISSPKKEISVKNTDLDIHLSFLSNQKILHSYNLIYRGNINGIDNKEEGNEKIKYQKYLYLKTLRNDYCWIAKCVESKNKKIVKEKKNYCDKINSVDEEINWVTKEKIESLLKKEKYDTQLDEYTRKLSHYNTERNNTIENTNNLSFMVNNSNTSRYYNFFSNFGLNLGFNKAPHEQKQLKEYKEKYAKLEKNICEKRKKYPSLKEKLAKTVEEKKNLYENYKQKQIILEQIQQDIIDKKKMLFKLQQKKSSMVSGDTQVTQTNSLSSSPNKIDKKGFSFFKKLFN